jgi:uncharacterized protein YjbJ (UPF0337 family)
MAATNRAKNDLQRAKGKTKEAVGEATGNRRLERRGKVDQAKGKAKNTGEKLKDTVRGKR